MGKIDIAKEFLYGLPVFKEGLRINPHYDERTKEVLRDERTHILASAMALYPFTPTKDIAKEFGVSASVISSLARLYGIKKLPSLRSAINSENASHSKGGWFKELSKPVEKVAKNGRVVAEYCSAHEAARQENVACFHIVSRCNGRIKCPLNGYHYRYKSE